MSYSGASHARLRVVSLCWQVVWEFEWEYKKKHLGQARARLIVGLILSNDKAVRMSMGKHFGGACRFGVLLLLTKLLKIDFKVTRVMLASFHDRPAMMCR